MNLLIYLLLGASAIISTLGKPASRLWNQSLSQREPENRIEGGETVHFVNTVPYYVFLELDKELCGGTIVNEKAIVTAAHCVDSFKARPEKLKIRAGFIDIYKAPKQESAGANIYIHEQFNNETLLNDIAVVCINPHWDCSKSWARAVNRLAVDDSDTVPQTDVQIAGFGKLKFNGTEPDQLQMVKMKIVGHERCEERALNYYPDTMICAGDPVHGHREGDSGGGLVRIVNRQPILVGVASFYIRPDNIIPFSGPGAYIKVSKYKSFLDDNLKKCT